MSRIKGLLPYLSVIVLIAPAPADDAKQQETHYPVAIVPFHERGGEVAGLGTQVSDLLVASLAKDEKLWLVDREDLAKSLAEQQLNLSGLVDPAKAIEIGHLTGAKILVTGSIFQADNSLHLVAKVIGTETTRLLAFSATGMPGDSIESVTKQLAPEILKAIKENSAQLVAAPSDKADRLKALKEKLAGKKHPALFVEISEQHIGRRVIDPAAQTEFVLLSNECGFPVFDAQQGAAVQASVLVKGEGISEFAARHGNLISVKARVEIKAIDRASGKVIVTDRETSVGVDVTEQIAAKHALQEASAIIAERMLPKIATAEQAKLRNQEVRDARRRGE